MKQHRTFASLIGTAALILCLLAGCTGTKPSASTSSSTAESTTTSSSTTATTSTGTSSTSTTVSTTGELKIPSKSDIQKKLDAQGTKVYDVTWAPNDQEVVFIQQDDQTSNIYVWKTGESKETLLSQAEDTTSGFSWSPDSAYFLINVGHMGPGTITSTLIETKNLKTVTDELTSVSSSAPVWSPDGKRLALSLDDEENSNTVQIVLYSIETGKSTTLLSKTNPYGPFVIASWEKNGEIHYTETSSTGDAVEKVIQAKS
jgi:Tol biopolymer transport system component